jgi:hypothetical protein
MKRALVVGVAVLVSGLLVLGLVGCGGGDDGPINISGTGQITTSDREATDGSYGDLRHITATRTGWILVTMDSAGRSPISDPYIVVWEGSSSSMGTVVCSDDDDGAGTNAFAEFYAVRGQTYTVLLTTYRANDLGTYSFSIREEVSSSAVRSQAIDDEPTSKPAEDKEAVARRYMAK